MFYKYDNPDIFFLLKKYQDYHEFKLVDFYNDEFFKPLDIDRFLLRKMYYKSFFINKNIDNDFLFIERNYILYLFSSLVVSEKHNMNLDKCLIPIVFCDFYIKVNSSKLFLSKDTNTIFLVFNNTIYKYKYSQDDFCKYLRVEIA